MSQNRLAVQRRLLNLTQEEAASLIGISRQSLSRYEHFKAEPSPKTWDKIVAAYQMPLQFLKGEDFSLDDVENDEQIFSDHEKKLTDDKKLLLLEAKKELVSLLQELNKKYSSREVNQLLGAMEFVTGKKLLGKGDGKLWVNLNVDVSELSYIKQTAIELQRLAALARKTKEAQRTA